MRQNIEITIKTDNTNNNMATKCYKYDTERVNSAYEVSKCLNQHAMDGWDFVSITHVAEGTCDFNRYFLIIFRKFRLENE